VNLFIGHFAFPQIAITFTDSHFQIGKMSISDAVFVDRKTVLDPTSRDLQSTRYSIGLIFAQSPNLSQKLG